MPQDDQRPVFVTLVIILSVVISTVKTTTTTVLLTITITPVLVIVTLVAVALAITITMVIAIMIWPNLTSWSVLKWLSYLRSAKLRRELLVNAPARGRGSSGGTC